MRPEFARQAPGLQGPASSPSSSLPRTWDSHSRTFPDARTCWGSGLLERHLAVSAGPAGLGRAQKGRQGLQGTSRGQGSTEPGGNLYSPPPHCDSREMFQEGLGVQNMKSNSE